MPSGPTERYTMVDLCLVPIPPERSQFRLTREGWQLHIEHFMKCFLDLKPCRILDTAFYIGDPDPNGPQPDPAHLRPVVTSFSRAGQTAGFADIKRADGSRAAVALYLPKLDDHDDATAIVWAKQAHRDIPEQVFQEVRQNRRVHTPNAINIMFDADAYDNWTVRAASQAMGIAMARLLGTLKDSN